MILLTNVCGIYILTIVFSPDRRMCLFMCILFKTFFLFFFFFDFISLKQTKKLNSFVHSDWGLSIIFKNIINRRQNLSQTSEQLYGNVVLVQIDE